VTNCFTQSSQK